MTDGIQVPVYDALCTFAPSRALDRTSYQSGGAGIVGTASDIPTFLEAIGTGGDPILQSSTVDLLISDHVGPQASTQGPDWGYGYGWSVLSDATQASACRLRERYNGAALMGTTGLSIEKPGLRWYNSPIRHSRECPFRGACAIPSTDDRLRCSGQCASPLALVSVHPSWYPRTWMIRSFARSSGLASLFDIAGEQRGPMVSNVSR